MASRSGVSGVNVSSRSTAKKKTKKDKQSTGSVSSDDIISKFEGNGLLFKAKLFGTATVAEARGDEMCQKALQMLKDAVKSNGEHKQKITIKINLDGVTLIDSASNVEMHVHSVNSISFICKDKGDNRSFAYIVGESDGKHTLFGIKTEKPADGVVLSLRDLFQAVYQQKQRAEAFRRSSRASDQSAPSENRISITSSNPSIAQSDSAVTCPVSPALSPSVAAKASHSPQLSSASSRNSSRLSGGQLNDSTTKTAAAEGVPQGQAGSQFEVSWNIPPDATPVSSPDTKVHNTSETATAFPAFANEEKSFVASDPFNGSPWGDSAMSASATGDWAAFGNAEHTVESSVSKSSDDIEEATESSAQIQPDTSGVKEEAEQRPQAAIVVKPGDFEGGLSDSLNCSTKDPFENEDELFGADGKALEQPGSASATADPFQSAFDANPFDNSNPFGDSDPFSNDSSDPFGNNSDDPFTDNNPFSATTNQKKDPFEETTNPFDVGHTKFDPFSEDNNPFDDPAEKSNPFDSVWLSKPLPSTSGESSKPHTAMTKETTFDEPFCPAETTGSASLPKSESPVARPDSPAEEVSHSEPLSATSQDGMTALERCESQSSRGEQPERNEDESVTVCDAEEEAIRPNSKVPDVVPDAPLAGEESVDDLTGELGSSIHEASATSTENVSAESERQEQTAAEHPPVEVETEAASTDVSDEPSSQQKSASATESPETTLADTNAGVIGVSATDQPCDTQVAGEDNSEHTAALSGSHDDSNADCGGSTLPTSDKAPEMVSSITSVASSDDGLEPPNCPAPSLPADTPEAVSSPLVLPNRSQPPAVPARRLSGRAPPPIPSRSGASPKISQSSMENKPAWPDIIISSQREEDVEPVFDEPSMPPPSLPPPSIAPPQLPARPTPHQMKTPPKIPERRV